MTLFYAIIIKGSIVGVIWFVAAISFFMYRDERGHRGARGPTARRLTIALAPLGIFVVSLLISILNPVFHWFFYDWPVQ